MEVVLAVVRCRRAVSRGRERRVEDTVILLVNSGV